MVHSKLENPLRTRYGTSRPGAAPRRSTASGQRGTGLRTAASGNRENENKRRRMPDWGSIGPGPGSQLNQHARDAENYADKLPPGRPFDFGPVDEKPGVTDPLPLPRPPKPGGQIGTVGVGPASNPSAPLPSPPKPGGALGQTGVSVQPNEAKPKQVEPPSWAQKRPTRSDRPVTHMKDNRSSQKVSQDPFTQRIQKNNRLGLMGWERDVEKRKKQLKESWDQKWH